MLDLKDTTFVIPLRIESVSRLENTLVIVDYLLNNFNTSIKILEAAKRNNGILQKLLPNEVEYYFVEDFDDIFHRTKYINQLVSYCNTSYLSVWDTDVIIPISQIQETLNILRKGEAQFITPYKDKFLDTSFIIRDLFIISKDLNVLHQHQGKMKALYNPNPVGGVFFADTKSYSESGLENEKFYGWGREDGDRINRWKILDYSHLHIDGPLYHLSHERGINSAFHSPSQDDVKFAEIYRCSAMSKTELKEEVNRWR